MTLGKNLIILLWGDELFVQQIEHSSVYSM